MYPPRKPVMHSHQPLHTRLLRAFPTSPNLHSLVLRLRRFRRLSRPLVPIAVRFLIVLFTAFAQFHFHSNINSTTTPTTTTTTTSSSSASAASPFFFATFFSTFTSTPTNTNIKMNIPFINSNTLSTAIDDNNTNSTTATITTDSNNNNNNNNSTKDTPPSSSSSDTQQQQQQQDTVINEYENEHDHETSTSPTIKGPDILSMFSRFTVALGTFSAFLSVIFFDVALFSILTTLCSFFCLFPFSFLHQHHHHFSISFFISSCFHITAMLFSMLVGRRRSISKPGVLRSTTKKHPYLHAIRYVDLIDAAIRIQTSLLVIDVLYSSNMFLLMLLVFPVALSYAIGYATRKTGPVLLLMLFSTIVMRVFEYNHYQQQQYYYFIHHYHHMLMIPTSTTACTSVAAFLGLVVGPGLLTVDEWLATTNQLCY